MEGIVLRVRPYREKQTIVTLFTAEEGLLTLFMRQKTGVAPPARGEFTLREGNRGAFFCNDVAITCSYIGVRKSLAHLRSVGTLLDALIASQLPGKPSPELYTLLTLYLDRIAESKAPETLALSFTLKLQKYEGTLALNPAYFSAEEWEALETLTHARSFAAIEQATSTLDGRALASALESRGYSTNGHSPPAASQSERATRSHH